jgi:hypothetical protein
MTPVQTRILIWILSLGLLAAAAWWINDNFTLEPQTIPAEPKGEARSNDLFAAQRFAQVMGANASSESGFSRLPPGNPREAVLVLPTARLMMTARQRGELQDWVKSGGRLVVVAQTMADEDDRDDKLLDDIDVRQYWTTPRVNRDGNDSDAKNANGQPPGVVPNARTPVPIGNHPGTVPGGRAAARRKPVCPELVEAGSLSPRFPSGKPLRVCFDTDFRLETNRPILWQAASEKGIHALTVGYFDGRVTVLTDHDFMTNAKIGKADHADFLSAVLGFEDRDVQPREILFIPRDEYAGILRLTWRYAWPVVLTLALWLLLGLWRMGSRFGPIETATTQTRRSLAEHVRATGYFLWHNQGGALMLQAVQAVATRRLERRFPALSFPTRKARLDAAAAAINVDTDILGEALQPRGNATPELFLRAIATLEKVRKTL